MNQLMHGFSRVSFVGLLVGAGIARADDLPIQTGSIDFDSLVVATEPAYATSAAPVRLRVAGNEGPVYSDCPSHGWKPPKVAAPVINFEIESYFCPSATGDTAPAPLGSRVERLWDVGSLAAGVYTVRFVLEDSGDALAQSRIEVHEPSTILRLGDFTVTAERGAAAPTVPAQAVPLTVESGYFTFYQPSNVEITVKILDGRSLNGHYWVFLASMTDQPFEVTVLQNKDECLNLPTDPKHVCPWRSYKAAAGKNQNFIDVVFPLETPSVTP